MQDPGCSSHDRHMKASRFWYSLQLSVLNFCLLKELSIFCQDPVEKYFGSQNIVLSGTESLNHIFLVGYF